MDRRGHIVTLLIIQSEATRGRCNLFISRLCILVREKILAFKPALEEGKPQASKEQNQIFKKNGLIPPFFPSGALAEPE